MAASALLRSMARKLARAPPPPHPRPPLQAAGHHRHHILNRRLHSGTTAPPTGDKDKIIEDLRLRLRYARASAGVGGFTLTGLVIYGYFWLLPAVEKERQRLQAVEKKLKPEDEPRSASLAQIIATAGHRKQQRDGTTEKATIFDKLAIYLMVVCLDILKKTRADLQAARTDLEKARADLMEAEAAMDRIVSEVSSFNSAEERV